VFISANLPMSYRFNRESFIGTRLPLWNIYTSK
jgi:hypothetical protein